MDFNRLAGTLTGITNAVKEGKYSVERGKFLCEELKTRWFRDAFPLMPRERAEVDDLFLKYIGYLDKLLEKKNEIHS
jgi:hypothetical protein